MTAHLSGSRPSHVLRNRRLRRILAAFGLFGLVEYATWLTIVLVGYEQGGAVLAGVAAFAMLLPAVPLVPLSATQINRLPRGDALLAAHVCVAATSTAAGVLLLVGAPFAAVLAAGAALTTSAAVVKSVHFAAIPRAARSPGEIVAANGSSSFMSGVALFLGFLLAGVLTERFGAGPILLGGGAVSLTAASLCFRLGLGGNRMPASDGGWTAVTGALHGLRDLRGTVGVFAILLLLASISVVEGANDVLTVAFNDQVLGRDASTAGLLAGVYGIGVAAGGALLVGAARRPRLGNLVTVSAVVLGAAEIGISGLPSLPTAVVLLTVVGASVAVVQAAARTLLQRSTDDAVLAHVLAVQEGIALLGLTVGALAGPLAITVLGARFAFAAFGLAIVAVAALSLPRTRALDARAQLHLPELELLSQVPFLAALPPYELERLAQAARWLQVPPGTDVVRQGDPGDDYYVVSAGSLSVAVDGRMRDHTLGPGDGFGEIALLHRVTRTATVTAVTDCELLIVGSERFLAAVTASPDGSALADELTAAHLAADRKAR